MEHVAMALFVTVPLGILFGLGLLRYDSYCLKRQQERRREDSDG